MFYFYRKNYCKIWNTIFKLKKKTSFLEAPEYVQWIATHKCNYSCEHCGTNAGKALTNELSTQEIKSIIDEMSEMGVKYLSVTGGEPLLREDLFEVLDYAKKRGIKVGFVTHGSSVVDFKEQIRKLHPISMMVSIDGLKKTHNKIRGDNANFDKTLEAVKFFKDIKVPVRSITTTVNKKNLNELEKLKKIVFDSGANHWRINIAIPEGRGKNKEWMFLNNEELIYLFNFIKQNRKKFDIQICEGAGYLGKWDRELRKTPFFCGCGWNTCTIMANGDVMGCPIFENQKEYSEGNIREMSFKDIWEKGFKRFRNFKLPDDCHACEHLNACLGGCWIMRVFNAHCLKEAWDKNPL